MQTASLPIAPPNKVLGGIISELQREISGCQKPEKELQDHPVMTEESISSLLIRSREIASSQLSLASHNIARRRKGNPEQILSIAETALAIICQKEAGQANGQIFCTQDLFATVCGCGRTTIWRSLKDMHNQFGQKLMHAHAQIIKHGRLAGKKAYDGSVINLRTRLRHDWELPLDGRDSWRPRFAGDIDKGRSAGQAALELLEMLKEQAGIQKGDERWQIVGSLCISLFSIDPFHFFTIMNRLCRNLQMDVQINKQSQQPCATDNKVAKAAERISSQMQKALSNIDSLINRIARKDTTPTNIHPTPITCQNSTITTGETMRHDPEPKELTQETDRAMQAYEELLSRHTRKMKNNHHPRETDELITIEQAMKQPRRSFREDAEEQSEDSNIQESVAPRIIPRR